MKNKKEIYIISTKTGIVKKLNKILEDNYRLKQIKNIGSKISNTIVLFDLTGYDLSDLKKLARQKITAENNLRFFDYNIVPLAIIDEKQKKHSDAVLKLNFEDFLIHPFFDNKVIATINNTIHNVDYINEINTLNQLGIELSSENNPDVLLQKILSTCRDLTLSDGGSIYTVLPGVDPEKKTKMLCFQYSQNDTLGNIYEKFTIPINKNSISGYVAFDKKTLNIADCYKIPKDAEYKFFDNFDKANNYITRSMMTVPMINHVGDVIGVVQLINRKKQKNIILDTKEKVDKYVIPFDFKCERLIRSLTSQASISLENSMLYKELKDIFDSFIEASALAVESRDPSTAGHSRRVSIYSVAIAKEINRASEGPFKNVYFSDDELLAIRYSALLHDFGKIGITENVLTKSEKIMLSEFEIIKERFETIRYHIGTKIADKEDQQKELIKIDEYFKLLEKAKVPGRLTESEIDSLNELAKKKYITVKGEVKPYLTDNELKSYLIQEGSLTKEERDLIRSHVFHSFKFLDEIPWPSNLKKIPRIAFTHHEMMDGSGYPNNLKADEIPLETQILCVADLYDALVSSDRPYKNKIDVDDTLKILKKDADSGKLNKDIVDLFINTRLYEKYSF
jgi:HD-GYP domain-containing protein (c-di-GMP phosphodiesterase class II)